MRLDVEAILKKYDETFSEQKGNPLEGVEIDKETELSYKGSIDKLTAISIDSEEPNKKESKPGSYMSYFRESAPVKYLNEGISGAARFVKSNYFTGFDAIGAFNPKEADRKGMKKTFNYLWYGLGGVALPHVSDWYAGSNLRHEVVSKIYPEFLQPISMHNLQSFYTSALGAAPGSFTDSIAVLGAATALAAGGAYVIKKYVRDSKKKEGKALDKLSKRDMFSDGLDAVKNSPISSTLIGSAALGLGIFKGLLGSGKGYAVAASATLYKTAKSVPSATKRRGDSFFSKLESRVSDWLDSEF